MVEGLRRRYGLYGFWALMLLISGCHHTPPEQQLRQRIEAMRVAAQHKDAGEVMDAVADDFGGNGGLDRQGLERMLRLQMLANPDIGTTLGPVSVELKGDSATARFSVVLTGGNGRLLPERAQAYQLTTGWRRRGDDWLLYYAQWEPLGP